MGIVAKKNIHNSLKTLLNDVPHGCGDTSAWARGAGRALMWPQLRTARQLTEAHVHGANTHSYVNYELRKASRILITYHIHDTYLPSPSDPNLTVYPKETPTIHKCTQTRLFITALFVTASIRNSLNIEAQEVGWINRVARSTRSLPEERVSV